jgi:hypothetical protein
MIASSRRFTSLTTSLVVRALKNNTVLTTVYLENTGIGDEGAQHLVNVLKNNTVLRTLKLYRNDIGEEGA